MQVIHTCRPSQQRGGWCRRWEVQQQDPK